MGPFGIHLDLTPQQFDIVRRSLARYCDWLSDVPDRNTGDPDPTPLQREKRGARELLGRVGYLEQLQRS